MKYSIRFSISTAFIAILMSAMGIVIGVNYYLNHHMLRSSTTQLMKNSTMLMQLKLSDFLKPLEDRAKTSAQLIQNQVLALHDNTTTRKYLLSLIIDRPHIASAFIGYPDGDFYILEKDYKTKKIHLRIVKRNHKAIQEDSIIDKNGNVITSKMLSTVTYDPRIRPWYTRPVRNKTLSWTPIYKYALTPEDKEVYGVSVSIPIYDTNQKLAGVFGMDLITDVLGDFLDSIKPSVNTFIFIEDSNGNLILPEKIRTKICQSTYCNIKDIKIPWVLKSLNTYQKKLTPFFFFSFNNKNYVASFKKINNLFGDHCLIGAILPLSDIAAPLELIILISVLITIAVLIISLLLAHLLSRMISKPISQLGDEAKEISLLNFEAPEKLFSRVKEVTKIRDAFIVMRHALNSFMKYVPGEIVKSLIRSNEIAHVGGKNREITLLFSDIKSFTTISESMKPSEVMEYLSEYFDAMVNIVHGQEGILDKYIGDGLMAFWGAPLEDKLHATHACQSALIMRRTLIKLNQTFANKNKPTITIRIGINTSEVIVGNVGAKDRLSYTALGDGVNLASRLEALNKQYDTIILVSESTYNKVKDQFNFRLIDHVIVKGKKLAGLVYELLDEDNPFGDQLDNYNREFLKAFDLYHKGEWNKAIKQLNKMIGTYKDDTLLMLYVERCKLLRDKKTKNWQGIWQVEHK